MVTPESIQHNTAQGLAAEHFLTASGDGRHFEAPVISEAFSRKSRVSRHRRVYHILGDRTPREGGTKSKICKN